jgi:para-nitrobenzyl esterase
VRSATSLGPSCPQPASRPDGWAGETTLDEDCLVLNVFAPNPAGEGRPVMVWFHGGGYTIGSASWPLYDGTNLARRGDTVVVTVNHRLGILGYLDLSEAGEPRSGNAGTLDLVAALEWVRDNVERFGGDPGNVTIFGESGGGAKVSSLLAMPAAQGLFHRAVVQSGAAMYLRSREDATALTGKVLSHLGIDPNGAPAALRALSADELLEAQQAVGGRMSIALGAGFGPVLDGDDLPAHPGKAVEAGEAADVPLMIGTTFDEATLFLAGEPALSDPALMSDDDLDTRAQMFGDRAPTLLAAYRASRPDATPIDLLLALQTDATMRMPSIRLAERRLAGGAAPVWMYLFTWAAGPLRSGHGFELPFVFDNVHEPVMHPSASREQLAERMAGAWLAFARHGDPNHDGLADWPPYDLDDRPTMRFDRGECDVLQDPWGAERLAWRR